MQPIMDRHINLFISQVTTLALAAHLADDPETQVRNLAIKYKKTTISPGIRRQFNRIINTGQSATVSIKIASKLKELGYEVRAGKK